MKKIITILAALAVILLPTSAFAGGSDSPVPYTLDVEGLTLPGSDTYPAHGHVNLKYLTDTGQQKTAGIHFDPNNNQPGGHWIGKSFIPWSAFADDIACITWVQIHGYNEHYGEGGQGPFCLQKPPTAPPTDAEVREVVTTVNCEERTVSWIKEKRTAIFDYDWPTASWVQTGWNAWVQIDSGIRNEKDISCDDLPNVGSGVTGLALLLGAFTLITGLGVTVFSRRSNR